MSAPQGAAPKGAGGGHTPGPWAIKDGFLVYAPSFGQIANVRGAGRDYYQADANARLIAAAPDLLEALAEAVAFHDGEDNEILASWRAALAKAGGES